MLNESGRLTARGWGQGNCIKCLKRVSYGKKGDETKIIKEGDMLGK